MTTCIVFRSVYPRLQVKYNELWAQAFAINEKNTMFAIRK